MKRVLFLLVAAAAAGSVCAAGERTLSADGKTLTFNVASGVIWTNTVPIESTVTNIVKEGAGDACLVPQTNTTFTGEITIKAGFFSGLQKSFGKPSKLTVENGGALVFLDLMPGSIGGSASSPFWNTKFFIAGDGPDHYGAIQRPVTHCDHVINGLCKEMTLTADAMLNCGSRWGFAGTTLDMNNHKLTFSAAKHTYPGSATKWNSTFSPIFQFARSGDLAIRNPGSIEVIDGANILIEDSSKVKDASDSNGSVSNMVMTLKSGTQLRSFSVGQAYASNFKVRGENGSGVKVYNTTYFDGPIEAVGETMSLTAYEAKYPKAFFRGGLTATNTTISHGDTSTFTFTGSHTNVVRTFNQNGTGPVTLKDDNVFVMSNWWVGAGSGVSLPGRMIVRDNAQVILCPGLERASTLDVGGRQNGEGHYGLLEVSGNAVVSNALAVGNFGRGALYQDGGRVHVMESVNVLNRGNNNAYFGMYGYGYVGINGGLFTQGYWFNLGGYDDGRGFIVQRGGVMEHWDAGDPLRMCFSGDRAYANIAQLGGRSTWKGYATMGFSNYAPLGYGSTATITVSGTNTVMDMSANTIGIRMVVSTNAHRKAWTGNVNLNDGGTLHAQHIYMTQMGGAAQGTPAWDSLDPVQVRKASKPYINFNGGILKMAANGEFFSSSATDHRRELERVTVYEKGAILDTNGKDVTWRMPFLKPYGYGLKSATLPSSVTDVAATNILIGPSRCYIASTNGGFAADLLMDFSNATRRVMGVLVTCPGCGYEPAPVVTFEKANSSYKDVWTAAVETVNFDDPSFRHGGLTKRGTGTLTLTAANTYGGATRLEGGTLAFTDAAGIPSGSALEFTASGLTSGDRDAPLLTAPAFPGGAIRITEADTLEVETFGRLRTIARFTTALSALPTLTLVNSDGTESTDNGWRLSLSADGKTLKFGVSRGLLLLLR